MPTSRGAKSGSRQARNHAQQEDAPEHRQGQPQAAVGKQPLRHVDEQFPKPAVGMQRFVAIELIVGTADELVEILDRRRRQLISVGQGQVGTGRAIQIGEAGNTRGRRQLAPRAFHDPAKLLQFLPMPAAAMPSAPRLSCDTCRFRCRCSQTGLNHRFRRRCSQTALGRRCRCAKKCLLVQTAQEQVVIGVRRQVELPAQRLAQVAADFLPPRPRKHLAALHVEGKGQPQRPPHLKTRRDRLRDLRDATSRNFNTPAKRAFCSTTTIVPAAMSPSRWKRSLSDVEMNPTTHSGRPNSEDVASSGASGMASTARRTFRSTACQARIGWPWIVTTRMRMTRLPSVWPFHVRLQQPAVKPVDDEENDQAQTPGSAQQSQRSDSESRRPANQREDQDLDQHVDHVGRHAPRRPCQPIAERDVFRRNDLDRQIDLLATSAHPAHYGERDGDWQAAAQNGVHSVGLSSSRRRHEFPSTKHPSVSSPPVLQ